MIPSFLVIPLCLSLAKNSADSTLVNPWLHLLCSIYIDVADISQIVSIFFMFNRWLPSWVVACLEWDFTLYQCDVFVTHEHKVCVDLICEYTLNLYVNYCFCWTVSERETYVLSWEYNHGRFATCQIIKNAEWEICSKNLYTHRNSRPTFKMVRRTI